MNPENIDFFFPFFVFSYGILLTFVIENKALDKIAQRQFPAFAAQLKGRRQLAYVCLFVGGFWSLQNLLFS